MIQFRPRYSLTFLLLAVTLCAVVLGLLDVRRRALARLDGHVVRTVLEDLLSYRGNDSPIAFGGKVPTKLLFSVQAAGYRQTVDEVLLLHGAAYYQEAWAARSEEDIRQARQAAADLVRRIGSLDTFTALNPEDKRIEIAEKQDRRQKSGTWSPFDRPIQAWPPGYSRDGRFAVVRLNFPGYHGAAATYLLRKEDGTWKVVLRLFVFYA